jgi:hypothetical protein
MHESFAAGIPIEGGGKSIRIVGNLALPVTIPRKRAADGSAAVFAGPGRMGLAACVALLFAGAHFLNAATYYVSISGTDSNPGSLSQPWRTIQKAANSLAPGDTALVMSGTYNERVSINVSGSAGAGVITLEAYPGANPVIDGSGLTAPKYESALIFISGQAYILIQGFEIRNYITSEKNAVPAGIYVDGPSHDISIIGNKIHAIENNYPGVAANAFGVAFYGTSASQPISNILFEGNEVYGLRTGSSESVTFNGNIDGVQVLNNLVHDNNNIGIDFIGFEGTCPKPGLDRARNSVCRENTVWNIDTTGNPAYKQGKGYDPSADGIYVDGGEDIVIDRNVVFQCDIGIEVSSEHRNHFATGVTVRDNFIHHCLTEGISTGGYDRSVGWAEDCAFTNNTLYSDDTLQQGSGELELQYKVVNCLFEQNILYANSQNLLMSNGYEKNSGNTVDYNLYCTQAGASDSQWQWKNRSYTGFETYQSATGNDAHSLFADPLFITTGSAPNLHLQAASPAINAGNPAFVSGTDELDIDGNPRIVGGRVDIGAEEVQTTGS